MPYVSQPRAKTLLGGGDSEAAPNTPADPQAAPQPASSGAFTDFRAYLNANGPQASQFAQKLTQPIAQQADAASKLEPPFSLNGNVPGYAILEQQNAQRADAQKVLGTDPLKDLADKSPGYTPGMGRLDSYLYGAAGGGQQMADLRQKYSGLLGPMEAKVRDVPYNTPAVAPMDEEEEARKRQEQAQAYTLGE